MTKDEARPKFDEGIYGHLALNDLVVYAVHYLTNLEREISAESLVAECFLLFPKRFELRGYPEWPDSTVVNKRWIDCRDKGFITGSTARGFSITPKGLKLAEKVEATLTGKRPVVSKLRHSRVRNEQRTRAGRFVRSLEDSDAFSSYLKQKGASEISEFDFRSMLLCTMESSAATMRNNLEEFRQSVELYEREDLLDFMDECEKKFSKLLSDESGQPGFRGGMLKQKSR